ncbi:MAG: methylenetetrahydrofolate reductase [Deltaproteobacteria bacterium]|nr:methylenetetrahydrofolate reductase [Deltaproteobacteria bacterium]MBW1978947.1 methylenetetrahydrofolate reductase [Deltaproteobacteria bacterium]MBW2045539.1 methylenetetrahydrofolate reductase [Deltaproteobacteria bacterium]MBW2300681.1 methylenetetrahydrofolate reductase [Deltaproteobacteria bacterium]RLB34968.1 MAG: methylenetetrahydrofolate reductase [Deltaproteobacteria bacterium]
MSELKSGSNLEKVLKAGHFAFTGECGPPKGANVEHLREKLSHLKGKVDAVNITDNQTAVVRMSSWAACAILIQEGLEPNFQMVCRDRNRLAIQSDILGAYALGVRNMLCLSGDHQTFGNHPQAKNVYDIDSMQLISLVKKMRDEQKFMNDEEIDVAPKLFIGAASNPFAEPFEFRVYRLAMKIDSGADFIQTQCIYNMQRFRGFMKRAVDMGLHERCYILAGITPMKSVGMAQYMAKAVPGMDVPESLIKRLRGAGKGKVAEEGIKFAVEQIQELKEMEGVAGVHLMAIEWEHRVPEIAERAGMLPRPKV